MINLSESSIWLCRTEYANGCDVYSIYWLFFWIIGFAVLFFLLGYLIGKKERKQYTTVPLEMIKLEGRQPRR